MRDLSPEQLKIYGYCVTIKDDKAWKIEQCDEYSNLPAHYPFMAEAIDRCEFLKSKGIESRVAALITLPTDTAEEFERSKLNGR